MISVFDIEVFPNLFLCSFKNISTLEERTFVVSPWQNDFVAFVDYFLQHKGLIGYNNVDYDYRVIDPFINESREVCLTMDAHKLNDYIYRRSNEVIDENFKEQRVIPLVSQRDLFRLWHFNNKARMVSLKYLQIQMNWPNVQESPYNFNEEVKEDWVKEIIGYNLNDVRSTLEFYNRSKDKIRLRTTLGARYHINMGNFSDNKIGETIFVKELAQRTRRTERSIYEGRTPRKNIPVRDCLIEGIEFTTKEFKVVHEIFKKMVITDTRNKDKKSMATAYYDGTKYEFGMGGLHALRAKGIYRDVQSADVSSYYPNLAIGQRIYPNHLGEIFCDVYKKIYDERQTFNKKSDEYVAFKAALVCVFGSSNAPWSPFFDPKYTMSITINGQLLLAMLCEQLVGSGAGRIVMANTDGIEVEVKEQDKFKEVCSAWQTRHKLLLEFSKYKKIAIRDVNAYVAIKENDEVKSKGDFEIEKDLWKDHSMRIVPIAVNDYFVKGIPVIQTINNCIEINKFLIGKRAKTGRLEYRATENGDLVRQKMPKNVRYYVSSSGGSLVKLTKATDKQQKLKKDDVSPNQISIFDVITTKQKQEAQRVTAVHKGYRMTLFNQWIDKPFEEYNVDKQFYVREANKLINSVIQNQVTL